MKVPAIRKWGGAFLWGGMVFSVLQMASQAQSMPKAAAPNSLLPQNLLESHNPLASCASPKDRGLYEKRLKAYQEALQENAKDAEGHYHLGVLQARLQQWEQSQAAFFQALTHSPEPTLVAKVYHQLGNLYACQRRFDEAMAQYKQTLRHTPNAGDTQHNLALTQLMARQEKQTRQAGESTKQSSGKAEPESSENPSQMPAGSYGENSKQDNPAPPESTAQGASEPNPLASNSHLAGEDMAEDPSPDRVEASRTENDPTAKAKALSRQQAHQLIDTIPENRHKFLQRLTQRQNLPAEVWGKDW